MNGRIYDPLLGRFLQADPFVQAPKNSQSLNRYSYVFNNPLSFTDPTGFTADDLRYIPWLWDLSRDFPFNRRIGNSGGSGNSPNGIDRSVFDPNRDSATNLPPGILPGAIGNRSGIGIDAFSDTSVTGATIGGTWSAETGGNFTNGGNSETYISQFLKERQISSTDSRVTVTTRIDPVTGAHEYVIRGTICSTSKLSCNDDLADRVFDHVNRNDIPFINDDLGSGPRDLLPPVLAKVFGVSRQPIVHIESKATRESRNITEPDHEFHPGDVVHRVKIENGELVYEVRGTGTGSNPEINNIIGVFIFRRGVIDAVDRFGEE